MREVILHRGLLFEMAKLTTLVLFFITNFLDMELGQLPRRETDNAIIISNATRMYKLHGNQGEIKIVKR